MSTKLKMLNLNSYANLNERATPHSLLNPKNHTVPAAKPKHLQKRTKRKASAVSGRKGRPRDHYDYSPGDERPSPYDALARARSGGGWNPR